MLANNLWEYTRVSIIARLPESTHVVLTEIETKMDQAAGNGEFQVTVPNVYEEDVVNQLRQYFMLHGCLFKITVSNNITISWEKKLV